MNDISTVARTDEATALSVISPDQFLSAVLSLAANPHVDVSKVEALMRMHTDLVDRQRTHKLEDDAREAERAFIVAMNAVQREMPPVARDTPNQQTKSRYAKLESIVRVLQPIFVAHGFTLSFSQGTADEKGEVRVDCTVSHIGGHSKSYHMQCRVDNVGIQGSVNKTEIHGVASAITYLRRYLTTLIFNIITPEDDDDGNAAGRKPDQQTKTQPARQAQQTKRADPPRTRWLDDVIGSLERAGDKSPWDWLKVLAHALSVAPTIDDVRALMGLQGVIDSLATAPTEAKDKIAKAHRAAFDRFKPTPTGNNPETLRTAAERYDDAPSTDAPPFETVLIDQTGEPLDRLYDDACDFARDFIALWNETEGNIALFEHNADALEDAKRDPKAAAILAELDETPVESTPPAEQQKEPVRQNVGQNPSPVVRIEPPLKDGKSHWPSYKNAMLAAVPGIGASTFAPWIEHQRAVIKASPMAQRAIVIRAILAHAQAIGVLAPSWLNDLLTGNKVKPDTPPASNDDRAVANLLVDLDVIQSQDAFTAFARSHAVQTLMARLRREQPALFEQADKAFGEKAHTLAHGAGR